MPKISFELGFKTPELNNSLDIPVELRKANQLIARGLSSQGFEEVEPGNYFISAELPGGQEIIDRITVKSGENSVVQLTPAPDDESPLERLELPKFIGGLQVEARGVVGVREVPTATGRKPAGRQRKTVAKPAAPPLRVKLRIFSGNVIRGLHALQGIPDLRPETHGNTVQIRLSNDGSPKILQILEPDRPATNLSVAAWLPGDEALLVLARSPDGVCALDMHLRHRVADMLLRYHAAGAFGQVAALAGSAALTAEMLLHGKTADPVAAAAGAYALLRFGDVKRLHDWTANLNNWFPWLPDGAAIYGEHMARFGKHRAAAEAFSDVVYRGLPIFCDGLSYAFTRLAQYSQIPPDNPEAIDVRGAQAAYRELARFTQHTDFRVPFVRYHGVDPGRPSDGAIGDELSSFKGYEVALP